MPIYEYVCKDCHKSVEKILTLVEHDKEPIACPDCGSKNVDQEAAAFFAVNPACSATFHYLHEGKLYPIELRSDSAIASGTEFGGHTASFPMFLAMLPVFSCHDN